MRGVDTMAHELKELNCTRSGSKPYHGEDHGYHSKHEKNERNKEPLHRAGGGGISDSISNGIKGLARGYAAYKGVPQPQFKEGGMPKMMSRGGEMLGGMQQNMQSPSLAQTYKKGGKPCK